MNISKSKYVNFCQCPKILWMEKYMPEKAEVSSDTLQKFANGKMVGEIARELFGDYVDTTTYMPDGKTLDYNSMIKKTNDYMAAGVKNICEAAFSARSLLPGQTLNDGDLYCAVDILHLTEDGYEVYEVKSSTGIKDYYFQDVAFQKYVLEQLGVKIAGYYLVYLNNEYVRNGAINIKELFSIEKFEDELAQPTKAIPSNILDAQNIIKQKNEPNIDISEKCKDPHECAFSGYCHRNLPIPSVFDIYGLRNKYEFYKDGDMNFEDVLKSDRFICKKMGKQKPLQIRQMETHLQNKPDHVDKAKIKSFLAKIEYPIYFLDFETINPPVPFYDGTRPYQVIPFQYSLHYIDQIGAKILHKEFLADSPSKDPREELIKSLIAAIPEKASVVAYNMSYEKNVIEDLARDFPEYSDKLIEIHKNIKFDLEDVFKEGYYYSKNIGGSFSLKSVLPALFPGDKDLNYDNLAGVKEGVGASIAFANIDSLSAKEKQEIREQLLKYCGLDTLALVKIWEKLIAVSKP